MSKLNKFSMLVKKYDINLNNYGSYMYNEYPHKSIWHQKSSDNEYKVALKQQFLYRNNIPKLLYIHIPFCMRQCYFCNCYSLFTKKYTNVNNYLTLLLHEIRLLKEFFSENLIVPNFKKIHIGGGSPTWLNENDFDSLTEGIQTIVKIKDIDEFTIEIDPRNVTKAKMKYYHSKGINRISFGIQDFDPNVQKAINRIQPPELIEKLLTPNIIKNFKSINFDILCGLPRQTRDSFRKTMNIVTNYSPDRIMLMFLTYSPNVKKHQKLMNPEEILSIYERTILFHDALKKLKKNGYVRIGVDHFAKPTDELTKSFYKKNIHWDSLGYGSESYFDTIGLGVNSSSILTPYYYSQNVYSLIDYKESILNSKLPVFRGYKLTKDDQIRRTVMHNLRIYFFISYSEIEEKYNIVFREYFKNEITELNSLAKDGIINTADNSIEITKIGMDFVSIVCRIFDKYRRKAI